MKLVFSHLIISILVCLGAFAGYGVWYATVAAKSAVVENLQNTINTKSLAVNRIAATRATLASMTNDEAVVRNYFVSDEGVVPFIDSLEAQGRAQGAVVSVLSVSTSGTSGARSTLQLSLTVKGSFEAVMRTLGAIEYVPYDLSVASLSVSQDSKKVWLADLKLLVGSLPAVQATSTPSGAPVGPSPSTTRTL